MLQIITFILLLSFSFIFSQEKDPALPLSDVEGELASIVNGSVSIISGDLIDREIDLVIPGKEPLEVSRYYNGSDYHSGSLWNCWGHSLHTSLQLVCYYTTKPKDMRATLQESGSCTNYRSTVSARDRIELPFEIDHWSHRGLTNTGQGTISGQTNVKNTRIKADSWTNQEFRAVTGEGEILIFDRISRDTKDCPGGAVEILSDYCLRKRLKPDLNRILFDYNENKNFAESELLTKKKTFVGLTLTSFEKTMLILEESSGLKSQPTMEDAFSIASCEKIIKVKKLFT